MSRETRPMRPTPNWPGHRLALQLCSKLFCESDRGFDFDPPDRDAFDVDPEGHAERAAVGDQFGGCRERLLIRGLERVGGVL